MALVTRLSRLFQADFHAVLDQIEEPDLQLRQAVREMQIALDQDLQRQQLLQHEAEQIDKRCTSLADKLQALDEELDLCLAADQEDLARDLVRRKLSIDAQRQAASDQLDALASQRQMLAQQVDEQTRQLASMKQKLELLVSPEDAFQAASYQASNTIRDEEVEIALLREKQRRAQS